MIKAYRVILFVAVFLLSQFVMVNGIYAQADRDGKPVTSVNVKGNKAISDDTIKSKVRTKVGDGYSQEILNEDLKRLYATEYFTNVSIDVTDSADSVEVTFIIEEKPVIEDITFEGNKVFRAPKLQAVMKSKKDEMLNMSLLASDIAEIKALYIKKGYPMVDVTYKLDVGKELNKAKIMITVDEKSHIKVVKIAITGNKAIPSQKILKALETKPAWFFIRPGIFKEDVFQDDLERIRALYDDEGYLDVETTPKMDYSEDGKLLYITIDVNEGKQYLVGDLEVKGNLVLAEKDVRSKMAMKGDKPFSNRALRFDATMVKQYYSQYGYMNATIDIERTLNQETGKIDVAYTIDAKDLVYVGKIEVRGNSKTRDIVIRRELKIYPGNKFDGNKIKRSKERLYNLGLFEDVSFDTEDTSDPKFQDLIVNVKEAKTGEFSFGGGYSSIDFLVGFVEVNQRNFDILNFPTFQGAGQDLNIKAELGMVRRNYNISWTDPWIFGFPYSFGFDFYQTAHKRKTDIGWAYDERRTGGDFRLGKELTEFLRADLTYKLEEVRIDSVSDTASQDLRNEEGTNWISSPMFVITQDTRDNIYIPTKGYVLSLGIQDAGGIFGGDKDFVSGTGSAALYHTFFSKLVLEVKGRMGIANAYGKSSEVPIYERYFAGGANTIRGYRERAVGPRDPGSNDPIGGEALLIGNAELTFPIYEKLLKGAVFYDVGNVWRHAEDFAVGSNYRQGAGIGVRIKTPIGPVKLDYGYPLVNNYDDKKQGEFYFSMSHGF
ncbi:MAG: outer membrane protein assembly factor BamA [Candidatus Omnitrophota bacterium]